MTRDEIIAFVAENGHAADTAAVEALIRPAIHLSSEALATAPSAASAEDDNAGDDDDEDEDEDEDDADHPKFADFDKAMASLPLGASRLGGIPDLPPGVAWPTRDDVPMTFVAQIRLADVAPFDKEGQLPKTGSLLFFFNEQYDTSDMDEDAKVCAVLFHDGPDASLTRTPPPRIEYQGQYDSQPRLAPHVFGVAALRPRAIDMVPGGVSPFVTDGSPLYAYWQDLTAGAPGVDPGHENHLLGYVDEQDYVDAHANGVDDQLLLQVDSDDRADMNWGDANKLFFILHKDALANRRFDETRVYMGLG